MKELDPNHSSVASPHLTTKINSFHLNLKGHLDSYDHSGSIFVDVNGHGASENVFEFVKAFVVAGESLKKEEYDDAFKLYGEAAQLAAHLGQSDGVASACSGQGVALMGAHKLKKALVMMDHALELNPDSFSIQQYHKRSKQLIRERLEEKKRAKHNEEERAKHEEKERIFMEREKEKQEWLGPLREELELRKQQQFKVAKVHADSLKLSNDFMHYSLLDKQRLRKQYNAYTTDMTKGQVLAMMVRKVAPAVVLRATETAMAQRLMAHQAKILKKKKEKEELEKYLRKKRRETQKTQRFSVYQSKRNRKLRHVIESAENTIEACKQGMPLDILKELVNEEVASIRSAMKTPMRVKKTQDNNNQEEREREREREKGHVDKVSYNDVFNVLATRTNAMVVESMHPYNKGTCHIVEFTPAAGMGEGGQGGGDGDDEGVTFDGKHGLAICFHNYCDIKSGHAEIRFFSDKSCQYPVGDDVYHHDNLPTMDNPLFINTKSVVMMFKSRHFDDSHVHFSSWGWKMCIVKARSKTQFEEITLKGAVDAAIFKRVICGTTKAVSNCFISACFGGNVESLEYLLQLGEEFCFDVNERDMLTGNTLLHVAASCGREEVAQFLINNGALRDVQNLQLETPLHVATRCGYTHIVRLLIFEDEVVASHLDKEKRLVFSPEHHRKKGGMSKKKLRETKRRGKYVDTLRKAMLSARNHKGRTPHSIAGIGHEWGDELDGVGGPAVSSRPSTGGRRRPKSAMVNSDKLLIMLNEERKEFTPKKGFFMGRPVTAPTFLVRQMTLAAARKSARASARASEKRASARASARSPSRRQGGSKYSRGTNAGGGGGKARPSTAGGRAIRRTLREQIVEEGDDEGGEGRGKVRPTLIAWHKDEGEKKGSSRPKTAGARMTKVV
ncbi:hypothetical protein TL16_g07262 [Triparma laevis f. inornata]|nr:hypothetical protein TL16_g07262 [Triparma laevis f. inornata]